jgi:RimJ/RimL family protein N-acetyltransferase
MYALLPVSKEALPVVQDMARDIWNAHYIHIISQEQIDYMLKLMYDVKSLEYQIIHHNQSFFFIQYQQVNVGFIAISQTDQELFIHKWYIYPSYSRKGIGTQIFNLLTKTFTPKTIRLTVNRLNFKSINFYFKCGFKMESIADFDIGNGFVMNDFVMLWESGTD